MVSNRCLSYASPLMNNNCSMILLTQPVGLLFFSPSFHSLFLLNSQRQYFLKKSLDKTLNASYNPHIVNERSDVFLNLNHTAWLGSLCWCCLNAYDGCDWSRSFSPVKGWTAVQNAPPESASSFLVLRCPCFLLENRFQHDYRRFLKKSEPFLLEVRREFPS